ncbi:MAG: extracellular solute-binding protein [Defluviitaleaceae bacterium]|nr:extracellular solute-binding protein [Defluviitaleaceae bacterium]MCL2274787.1 extracellular solute-binding protein [Defluviitaleaceae bacterium]
MKNTKRICRLVLCAVILGILTPGLAACGRGDDDTIEISIAWWGSQHRHDITSEVIAMFMDQYPHIRVVYEFADGTGYFSALDTRAAANDVWDLFQLGSNYPVYIDHIVPLNDLISRGVIDISNTTQDFIDITTTHNGDIVGISNGVNAWGLAYDPAMFDAAGLPRPAPGWTWADFEHAAITIANTLGHWGMGVFTNDAITLTQFMAQKGVDFWHIDPRRLGFDDPSVMVPYFRMRQNMVAANAMPDPGEAMGITDIEGDPLVFGNSAMAYLASNQFIALANAALALDPNRQLSMTVLPTHPGGQVASDIVSSQMFSLSTSSRHPEEAAKFLNFWVNNVPANEVLQGERGIPIMEHVRAVLRPQATPVIAETYAFIDMIGDLGGGTATVLNNPRQQEVEDFLNDSVVDRLVLGMITPEEAAQEVFEFALQVVGFN